MQHLLLLLTLTGATAAFGQLATYSYDGTLSPTSSDATVTAAATTTAGINVGFDPNGGGTSHLFTTGYSSSTTPDLGDFFEVCLTPTGSAVDVGAISYEAATTGNGPASTEIRISTDGFNSDIETLGVVTNPTAGPFGSVSVPGPSGGGNYTSEFCIRFYSYNANNSGSKLRTRNLTIASPAAVPITLSTFDAEASADDVNLTWVVSSQLDNAYFDVEASRDGIEFERVGTVAGDGSTTEEITYEYDYRDVDPGLYYFRIRQMDYDGNSTVSPVVTIQVGHANEMAVKVAAANGELTVETSTDGYLSIFAASGQLVHRFFAEAGRQSVPVPRLPSGVYVLTDGVTSTRFAW